MNRNFFWLWQGLTASSLGAHLYNIIGILWLMEVADSASAVGLFLLAGGIPIAVFAPLGGVLADRFSRRNILVWADIGNGLTILSLAAIFLLVDSVSVLIVCVFVAQILLGISAGFFLPAVYALLPDILSDRRLGIGNAIINTTVNVTQMFGKGFGGLLFSLLGAPLLMLITGVSFLLSALSELSIKLPVYRMGVSSKVRAKTAENMTGMIEDVRQGISYIVENKGMAKSFLLMIGLASCLGVLLVNTPFLVQYRFYETSVWYGYLLASLSLGLILGPVYVGSRFNQLEGFGSRTHVFILSLIAMPIFCMFLAFIDSIYIALLFFLLLGIFFSTGSIVIITQVQATVSNSVRGRVISVFMMVNVLALPISSFVGGILIDLWNKDVVLIQTLSGILGCLIIYPLLTNKALWGFIGYSSKPVGSL